MDIVETVARMICTSNCPETMVIDDVKSHVDRNWHESVQEARDALKVVEREILDDAALTPPLPLVGE